MKIVLNSVEDLRELVGVMDPEFLRTWQPALDNQAVMLEPDAAGLAALCEAANSRRGYPLGANVAQAAGLTDEPDSLPTDIAQPVRAASDNPQDDEKVCTVQADADGVEHNSDWHSDPAKINGDGRWRARRKRDEDAYKVWLLEVTAAAEADPTDAEPVATETHALPQDDADDVQEGGPGATEPLPEAGPTVDLAALVEASQEAALDASDSHMDLIKACQQYIEAHGHPAYNALKAAVAPMEGSDNGKAIPQFTPGERRLMRACMANYPTT